MKFYEVKLTITVPITARSRPHAEERAEKLAELALNAINDRKWVDDRGFAYEHEVREEP